MASTGWDRALTFVCPWLGVLWLLLLPPPPPPAPPPPDGQDITIGQRIAHPMTEAIFRGFRSQSDWPVKYTALIGNVIPEQAGRSSQHVSDLISSASPNLLGTGVLSRWQGHRVCENSAAQSYLFWTKAHCREARSLEETLVALLSSGARLSQVWLSRMVPSAELCTACMQREASSVEGQNDRSWLL